jgi:hypothetical protein
MPTRTQAADRGNLARELIPMPGAAEVAAEMSAGAVQRGEW